MSSSPRQLRLLRVAREQQPRFREIVDELESEDTKTLASLRKAKDRALWLGAELTNVNPDHEARARSITQIQGGLEHAIGVLRERWEPPAQASDEETVRAFAAYREREGLHVPTSTEQAALRDFLGWQREVF